LSPSHLVLVFTTLTYLLFFFWYGGSAAPLTGEEADAMIDEIEANAKELAGPDYDRELIESFRVLSRVDDGREFYMLNLMRFRQKAVYPESYEHDYDDDAMAAASRYNAAVIPALLARGSLPILMGRYAGPFIPPLGTERWDQIGIIRYRSRRDMLSMAMELSSTGGGAHKGASLEKTVVFPIEPIFDFVFVRGFVLFLCAGTGGTLAWALRRLEGR
jgi:hypothetical protein